MLRVTYVQLFSVMAQYKDGNFWMFVSEPTTGLNLLGPLTIPADTLWLKAVKRPKRVYFFP